MYALLTWILQVFEETEQSSGVRFDVNIVLGRNIRYFEASQTLLGQFQ